MWVAAVIGLLVAVVGMALLWWGLRGRRVGDHPYCKKCGFDLFGSPEPRDRCGECGAELSASRAVVVGQRKRRWGVAVVGMVMLAGLATLGGVSASGALKNFSWRQFMPVSYVIWEMGLADPVAARQGFAEAEKRIGMAGAARRPTPGTDAIMEYLLTQQKQLQPGSWRLMGDVSSTEAKWREVMTTLWRADVGGLMTAGQRDRYEKAMIEPLPVRLRLPAKVRVGTRVRPEIELAERRVPTTAGGNALGYRIEFTMTSLADPSLRGVSGDFAGGSRSQTGLLEGVLLEAAGRHKFAYRVSVTLKRPDGSAAGTFTQDIEQEVEWVDDWTVELVERGERAGVDALAREMLSEMHVGIGQRGELSVSCSAGSIRARLPQPPQVATKPATAESVAVAGDLYLRVGDQELFIGSMSATNEVNESTILAMHAQTEPVLLPAEMTDATKELVVVFRAAPVKAEADRPGMTAWLGCASGAMKQNSPARVPRMPQGQRVPPIPLGKRVAQVTVRSPTASLVNVDEIASKQATAGELTAMLRGSHEVRRNAAVWEVTRRLYGVEFGRSSGPAFTAAEGEAIVEALLAIQADATTRWNPQAGDAMDLLWMQGYLKPEQKQRYLGQPVGPEMDAAWARQLQLVRGLEKAWEAIRLGRVLGLRCEVMVDRLSDGWNYPTSRLLVVMGRVEERSETMTFRSRGSVPSWMAGPRGGITDGLQISMTAKAPDGTHGTTLVKQIPRGEDR